MKTTLTALAMAAILTCSTAAMAAEENTDGFGDAYFANQPHPGFDDPDTISADAVKDIEPAAGDETNDVMIGDYVVIEREDSTQKLDDPANDNNDQ